eukprot:gene11715-15682_t
MNRFKFLFITLICVFSHTVTVTSDKNALLILREVQTKISNYNENSKDVVGVSDLPSFENQIHLPIKDKPFTTLSFAQTLDGSIAPLERARLHISSNGSFQLLHSLRACHDAVLIGINTLLLDRPRLNVRNPLPGIKIPLKQPRAVVIDSQLKCLDVEIFLESPIVLSTFDPTGERWQLTQAKLALINGELISCKMDKEGRCDLQDCLHILYNNYNIQSLLIEGGATIIQTCLELKLIDLVVMTIRPCFYGGYRSMTRQLSNPVAIDQLKVSTVDEQIVLFGPMNYGLNDNSGLI